MDKKKLTTPVIMAFILIAAVASAEAPRDIAFDDTRVFPESLGASADGTLYNGSWKGIVYRARPGETLATPWIKPSPENGLLTILGVPQTIGPGGYGYARCPRLHVTRRRPVPRRSWLLT
jgi:hypothetical protein